MPLLRSSGAERRWFELKINKCVKERGGTAKKLDDDDQPHDLCISTRFLYSVSASLLGLGFGVLLTAGVPTEIGKVKGVT